jgi:hypothetical protein
LTGCPARSKSVREAVVVDHHLLAVPVLDFPHECGCSPPRHCATDRDGDQLLRHALARLVLSARAYHRVLRVARTIADLSEKVSITAEHIAEAIQYRRLDASF